jgi:hypothetical protein
MRLQMQELAGRGPAEYLLDKLSVSGSGWAYKVKTSLDNRIENLFFARETSIQMLRENPDILLMDCTYRTNRYKLPLLHIVDRRNMQSFSAGFCFMRSEEENLLLGNLELL